MNVAWHTAQSLAAPREIAGGLKERQRAAHNQRRVQVSSLRKLCLVVKVAPHTLQPYSAGPVRRSRDSRLIASVAMCGLEIGKGATHEEAAYGASKEVGYDAPNG